MNRRIRLVPTHPHNLIQCRCREYTGIETEPDPIPEDAPDLIGIVGMEVDIRWTEQ